MATKSNKCNTLWKVKQTQQWQLPVWNQQPSLHKLPCPFNVYIWNAEKENEQNSQAIDFWVAHKTVYKEKCVDQEADWNTGSLFSSASHSIPSWLTPLSDLHPSWSFLGCVLLKSTEQNNFPFYHPLDLTIILDI